MTTPAPDQYANDGTYHGEDVIRAAVVGIALPTLVVAARFYAKRITRAYFGWDDGLILAANLFCIALCVVGIVTVHIAGLGKHFEYLKAHDKPSFNNWPKMLVTFELTYFTAVTLPKMSMLCLYLRIFNWGGRMRQATLVLLAAVAATWLAFVIATILQCVPLSVLWDNHDLKREHLCVQIHPYFKAQTLPGIFLTFIIMGLPLKTIWGLKLPTAKRVALLGIFLVASLGVVASIIRARIFFEEKTKTEFEDWTSVGVNLSTWTIVEATCYIIANCLPHLRPLISHYVHPRVKQLFYRTVETASFKLASHRRPSLAPGVPSRGEFASASRHAREPSDGADPAWEKSQLDQAVILTGLSAALQDMDNNLEQQPFSHDIAGGRPRTWAGQDPTRIQVTTELTWRSESV
ncbi:integral membrane protein [Podospora conica]|nr:integral membrane protein [Schizothecium conicum]